LPDVFSSIMPNRPVSAGVRRSYVVQQITRASSSHRPSFTFLGYAVEYTDGRGSQTERGNSAANMSARSQKAGSQTARGGQSQRSRLVVVATGLSLNITYEPPSPKFHQQCPGSSSYRLKLFKANDFLYSVRGLPQQVRVHQNAYIVRWGPLELQYNSKQQLDMFTSAVKHVELHYAPCGQTTARQTAATLHPSRTTPPLAPLDTNIELQSSQRSSFGSPLPEPSSDAEQSTSADTAAPAPAVKSGNAGKSAARVPVGVEASKGVPPSDTREQSFLGSSWMWIGLGIAAVAVVTYSAFKTDMPATQASRPVKAREFQLHVIS